MSKCTICGRTRVTGEQGWAKCTSCAEEYCEDCKHRLKTKFYGLGGYKCVRCGRKVAETKNTPMDESKTHARELGAIGPSEDEKRLQDLERLVKMIRLERSASLRTHKCPVCGKMGAIRMRSSSGEYYRKCKACGCDFWPSSDGSNDTSEFSSENLAPMVREYVSTAKMTICHAILQGQDRRVIRKLGSLQTQLQTMSFETPMVPAGSFEEIDSLLRQIERGDLTSVYQLSLQIDEILDKLTKVAGSSYRIAVRNMAGTLGYTSESIHGLLKEAIKIHALEGKIESEIFVSKTWLKNELVKTLEKSN